MKVTEAIVEPNDEQKATLLASSKRRAELELAARQGVLVMGHDHVAQGDEVTGEITLRPAKKVAGLDNRTPQSITR